MAAPMQKVHTHIGGSRLVVQLSADWEHYIDVRKDVRGSDHVELVRCGQVRRSFSIPREEQQARGPEMVLALLRQALCRGSM